MPWSHFSDDCPGCRPGMMDTQTGQVLPDDHPLMRHVLEVWSKTTLKERRAWHAVTCQNSRTKEDLKLARRIMKRINRDDDAA